MKAKAPFVSVPKLWPGSTVVCLASGPSLTHADVDCVRGRARVICVNDTWKLAPWADCLYAADAGWWAHQKGAQNFSGLKFAIEPQPQAWPGLQVFKNTGPHGLELKPTGLRTGLNSGYQSLGLAYHLGASRIVLLGFDMGHAKGQPSHFYGEPRNPETNQEKYRGWIKAFATLVKPLQDAGVSVVNCTPNSALKMFPTASLSSVLEVAA